MRIVRKQLIYNDAPTPECHASTLVELADGSLLSAWFGGLHEKAADVGIWGSRWTRDAGWSTPEVWADEPDVPCWNPVLFRDGDAVWLFYKVGPIIQGWTGCYRTSRDGGATWGPIEWMPAGLLGPIKNKPVQMSNGEILCGTSVEAYATWTCWAEVVGSGGAWERFGPIALPASEPALPRRTHGLIQPAVWESAPGRVRTLMRSSPDVGRICEATSEDYGRTWSAASPTALPNPNSGIDAVQLRDGRVALVYNPTTHGRTPISLSLSDDDGATWGAPFDLETGPGEFSYPAVIQTADGLIHTTFTHQRKRVMHVAVEVEEPARAR